MLKITGVDLTFALKSLNWYTCLACPEKVILTKTGNIRG